MDRYDPYTDKFIRDTIDRQAAIDAPRTCYDTETITMDNGDEYINYGDAVGEIEQLPSAQPKMGRWERHYSRPNVYADLCWHCSECGYRSSDNWAYKFNFCPHCGAKMEGEDE